MSTLDEMRELLRRGATGLGLEKIAEPKADHRVDVEVPAPPKTVGDSVSKFWCCGGDGGIGRPEGHTNDCAWYPGMTVEEAHRVDEDGRGPSPLPERHKKTKHTYRGKSADKIIVDDPLVGKGEIVYSADGGHRRILDETKLAFREGTSDKVYIVRVLKEAPPLDGMHEYVVAVEFGRRGRGLHQVDKQRCNHHDTALAAAKKIVAQKVRKGYRTATK